MGCLSHDSTRFIQSLGQPASFTFRYWTRHDRFHSHIFHAGFVLLLQSFALLLLWIHKYNSMSHPRCYCRLHQNHLPNSDGSFGHHHIPTQQLSLTQDPRIVNLNLSLALIPYLHPIRGESSFSLGGGGFHRTVCQLVDWMFSKCSVAVESSTSSTAPSKITRGSLSWPYCSTRNKRGRDSIAP